MRDPSDSLSLQAPPTVSVQVESRVWTGGGPTFVSSILNNGFDDEQKTANTGGAEKKGLHLLTLEVTNNIATLSRDLSARANVISTTSSNPGAFAVLSFRVSLDPREVSFYATPTTAYWFAKNEPDDKEINAYARLDYYNDGVAGNPLFPFYAGISNFNFFFSRPGNVPWYDNSQWTASPEVYLPDYIQNAGTYIRQQSEVAPSTRDKKFHWNLGGVENTVPADFPKSSLTTLTITDPVDGAKFNAKAKINWHLTPAMLFDLKLKMEPILPPDDEYDDGANDIWAVKEEIEADMKQALGTGCTIYKTVYYGTEFVITMAMPDETDLIPVAGRIIGKGAKALKVYSKLAAVVEAYKARKLARWLAKRAAKGKVGPVAVKSSTEVINKGKIGTRPPNYDLSEADEAVGAKEVVVQTAKQGMCFVAGTPILMGDNTLKSIEQIKVGDLVVSREDGTNVTTTKRVTDTIKRQAPATIVLTFSNKERIETTEEHPFYVKGKGFVKAGELGIGTSIVTRAGPSLRVLDVQHKKVATTVYNITVEDFHTYFVGNSKLWVHNGDCIVEQIARGHSWEKHVLTGKFADLGIVGAYGDYQKFADLIGYVIRNPKAMKVVNYGLDTEKIYYFDNVQRIIVVEFKVDKVSEVYKDYSTCYRVTSPDPWDYFNSLDGYVVSPP